MDESAASPITELAGLRRIRAAERIAAIQTKAEAGRAPRTTKNHATRALAQGSDRSIL